MVLETLPCQAWDSRVTGTHFFQTFFLVAASSHTPHRTYSSHLSHLHNIHTNSLSLCLPSSSVNIFVFMFQINCTQSSGTKTNQHNQTKFKANKVQKLLGQVSKKRSQVFARIKDLMNNTTQKAPKEG